MKPFQTPGVIYKSGFTIPIRNTAYQGGGFHISYNDRDISTYGCATTAIVVKNWDFYILDGDHREALFPLMEGPEGLKKCLEYFHSKPDQHNSMTVYG